MSSAKPFTEKWDPEQGDLGELMAVEEFKGLVLEGVLSDDDGWGSPALVGSCSAGTLIDPDTEVNPSDVVEGEELNIGAATHIVWYRK